MPEHETKRIEQFTKSIEGRTVTGIFAVHGNVDSGGDRSWPGLFQNTERAVFLWQHDEKQPPIANIKSIREISRMELPPQVLAKAPDATGGVEVVREYLTDAFADRVFGALKAGAIKEMSYAYEVLDSKPEQVDGRTVRNLYKADLFDISDVNWGMNAATSASKNMRLTEQKTVLLADTESYIERLEALYSLRAKEGRRFSSATLTEIDEAITAMETGLGRLRKLTAAPEPQKNAQDARQVFLDSQRILAHLNGAFIS